jgi:hypothetical protein
MGTFTDLFNARSRPRFKLPASLEQLREHFSQQSRDLSSQQLKDLLSQSSLGLWRVGDAVPKFPSRVLIGVATWFGYDMRLLDELNETRMRHPTPNERIEVFDANDVRNQEQFDEYVPGIGKAVGLPVVGIWENGTLTQKASGALALNLLVDRYSLNPERIKTLL